MMYLGKDAVGLNSINTKIIEEAPFNDINFYDKDGRIIYSYSKTDFLALENLPPNPVHAGLIAQGWNWTLNGAKTYVNKYGFLDIGQTYITDNGATRIIVWILEDEEPSMRIYWTQNKNDGVKVNWGDGSAVETVSTSGTGVKYLDHNYATVGKYVISLMPDDDCVFSLGNTGNYAIWGAGNSNYNWAAKIYAVNYGKNVEMNNGPTFANCHALRELTLSKSLTTLTSCIRGVVFPIIIVPYGVLSLNTNAIFDQCQNLIILAETITNITSTYTFQKNYSLTRMALPDSLTTLSDNAFTSCESLQYLAWPPGLTQIGSSAFAYCYSLAKVIIPSTVTSIGTSAFNLCRGCKSYYLYPTTPPTLGNNAFAYCKSDLVIYVPYSVDHSILNAYKTADNWSNYASYMQEMEVTP